MTYLAEVVTPELVAASFLVGLRACGCGTRSGHCVSRAARAGRCRAAARAKKRARRVSGGPCKSSGEDVVGTGAEGSDCVTVEPWDWVQW